MVDALLALVTDFTARNVVLGAGVLGILCGAVGSFAVLRRQSLLGDMLAHAALPGIVLGFLATGTRSLPPLLAGALLSGAAWALLLQVIARRTRLKDDGATTLTLSLSFALGLALLAFATQRGDARYAGLDSFLFGQAASLLPADVTLLVVVASVVIGLMALAWKELALVTFDRAYARTAGVSVVAIESALTVALALAVVVGLQLVGVVLMTALVVAPAVAARQWTDRLGHMVMVAAAIGASSAIVGAAVSASVRGMATGPVIVLVASFAAFASLAFAPRRGLVWASRRRRRRES
ncbi:MAG: metal ABC transporter permease [Trueperaceae bacterium]|nr:metal ABC transporter permease [Trueperaceae bacterium]